MAVPAAGTLVRMEDARTSDLTVKITGYQWKWHDDYIADGVSFFSTLEATANQARQLKSGIDPWEVENYLLDVDRPLVVPVGAKVRLLLTSNDVIHAWWVPALGGKKDAIPGYINEFWFQAEEPGIYRGQCAELCGRDHAFMPVVVEVVPEDQFVGWLGENAAAEPETAVAAAPAGAPAVMAANEEAGAGPAASAPAATQPSEEWSTDRAMALGEELYMANCAACHQADGQGIPAAGFPPLAGSAVVTGPIPAHAQIAVHGKPGTAMAAFGPQLSDEQVAAILTYQRNSWGNETGDLVQPSDVAEVR
jgi:cytochrome c oxidase subunit 2